MDGTTSESETSSKCQYCDKLFKREKTLAAHLCEGKRRWQQERETGVQLGFKAYLRFYATTQRSTNPKTYADFADSPYYNAFVKFGRYCQTIRCVNFSLFLDWLLRNNKKLDIWCSDKLYTEWLPDYLKKEAVQDALERALKEMQHYADEHPELKNGFVDYFRYGNNNRICHHIITGRISPWIVYNCDSGVDFLGNLSEEQVGLILHMIDPDFWQRKFRDHLADAEWTKEILRTAGL
jgi:hypothetical protein